MLDDSLVYGVFVCFRHFPLWCPKSGVVPDICLLHYFKDVDYCFCFSLLQYIIFMVILLLGEIAGGIYVALEKGTVSIILFPHLFVAKYENTQLWSR